MFRIAPAFETTSEPLGDLDLCHARLQDDARFPWIVLIPRVQGLREIEELSAEDRVRLLDEAVAAGGAARAVGEALGRPVEKLNLGQLGNITPQLHVHVIGRRTDDPAWPGPVWGSGEARPYRPAELAMALVAGQKALGL